MSSTLNLNTRTPIQREQFQKLKNIVQSLIDHNDSVQFRVPVAWEAYGLLDYPTIIKKPMDLGTVQSKLNNAEYLYVQDVIDQIQLIWDNCKLYNLPGSWIYNLADKLEKNFKKLLKNYLPLIPFASVPGKTPTTNEVQPKTTKPSVAKKKQTRPVQIFNDEQEQQKITYQQKVEFSQKLKLLSPQNLGMIVQRILTLCPTAFSDIGSDRVQILMENIDLLAFKQLDQFTQQLLNQEAYGGVSKKIKIN